jgi:hypothetical protein
VLDPESGRPALNPETLECNLPGVFLAGSITAGKQISEIFIENGRYDGEKIFGDPESRSRAVKGLEAQLRPVGE